MASLALDPGSAVCVERKRLGAEYLQAVKELNGLIEVQARALVKGDGALDQFDLALDAARDSRDTAKLAYDLHVQAHGR